MGGYTNKKITVEQTLSINSRNPILLMAMFSIPPGEREEVRLCLGDLGNG